MKSVFFSLLFFVSSYTYGQESQVQKLVESAYKEIVPVEFCYFNLVDSSFVIKSPTTDKCVPDEIFDKDFYNRNPDFKADDFIAQLTHVKRINWNDYQIPNARVCPRGRIPRFPSQILAQVTAYIGVPYYSSQHVLDSIQNTKEAYEVVIPMKKYWGWKKVRRKGAEVIASHLKRYGVEDGENFYFSTPLFSVDKTYAIMQLNGSGHGFCCVFKKNGAEWKCIHRFRRWSS